VVECLGGIHAFFGHHFTPIGAKVCKEVLDCLVGVAKVFFIELLDVLFLNTVDDALYTYVGDGPLKLKCLLLILCYHIEVEKFALQSVIFDGWIDRRWLNKVGGQFDSLACDSSVVDVVKNQGQIAMESAHAVVLTGATICTISSIIRSMDLVVGCPTIVSSGFATMMRLTIAWMYKPPAEE
jgi:hypothetical protein